MRTDSLEKSQPLQSAVRMTVVAVTRRRECRIRHSLFEGDCGQKKTSTLPFRETAAIPAMVLDRFVLPVPHKRRSKRHSLSPLSHIPPASISRSLPLQQLSWRGREEQSQPHRHSRLRSAEASTLRDKTCSSGSDLLLRRERLHRHDRRHRRRSSRVFSTQTRIPWRSAQPRPHGVSGTATAGLKLRWPRWGRGGDGRGRSVSTSLPPSCPVPRTVAAAAAATYTLSLIHI